MEIMHLNIFEIIAMIILTTIAIIGILGVIDAILILILNLIISNLCTQDRNKITEFILSICIIAEYYLNKFMKVAERVYGI